MQRARVERKNWKKGGGGGGKDCEYVEGVLLRTAWRPIRYPSVRVVQKFKK